MKTFFTILLLMTHISWAETNPANRNGLDAVLSSALSEHNEVKEIYNQMEIAKRYYQEQFNPSVTPEVIGISERETVTVETRLDLEVKKEKPSRKLQKATAEHQKYWFKRAAQDRANTH
jgi:hypothetical protein